MPNILYITVRADYGGGPEHIHQLIKGLSPRFGISVACPNEEPYWQVFSRYADCIEIPHRRFSLAAFNRLYKAVKDRNIGVIHSQGRGAGVYSRLLGLLTGVPVVHTFQGVHYRHLGLIKKTAYLGVERVLAAMTSVLINASESEKEVCVEAGLYGGKKSLVIPNGVEVPPLAPGRKAKGVFTILNVSRLSPEKGVDVLLDAVLALAEKTREFRVLVVGDGPERAALEEKAVALGIADLVMFLGYVDDVEARFLISHLYLTASRGEGMPLTVLEALARGLPVVASNVTGNKDTVINGKTGYLFDIGSPQEAADKICSIMKDDRLRSELSRNARKDAVERFSSERMCGNVAAVYMRVLGLEAKTVSRRPAAIAKAAKAK
ncbi:MAG: glycosyltransferase [Deltaproteobacteria bacterium]|nr:glycosyltransferase [Deltaproteobacteria bacterium]